MKKMFIIFFFITCWNVSAQLKISPDAQKAMEVITPNLIRAHIEFLSDDLLEGRAPATHGSQIAIKYIAGQFEMMGLEPAGDNSTYFQKVPIVGMKVDPSATLNLTDGKQTLKLKYPSEFVGYSGVQEPVVNVDAEMIFVGYGIVAPEQNWDDYKGVDVSGKILLMLNDDPPSDDPKFFGGKARTYYGRWTYKYEIAAKKGTAGAIVIHTTPSAGYPYQVVESSWGKENFFLEQNPNTPTIKLKAWTTEEATKQYLAMAGFDLAKLQKMASERSFTPVPLGIRVQITLHNSIRKLETYNVLGLLRGSDPQKQNEVVIYSAHHDHLGIGKPVNGDSIYNGALDNASGTSLMLSMAKAYTNLSQRPKRSILFAAVAAEEQGLLGSQYYAEHPTFPPKNIAANINTDGANVLGKTTDITFLGAERSSLGEVVKSIAKLFKMEAMPDPFPEQGSFYRSDHFSFAKVGIPSVSLRSGTHVIGKSEGWGKQKHDEYVAHDYHQPSDEMKPWWDFSGAVQEAHFCFLLGLSVANQDRIPQWNPGDEFEGASMGK